ncbi:hypothetical protein GPX89_04105 [Nocardia sp. ET3-3]|uniref:Uncharacterized protein n=1 Tax=Nocardia terrae TaxID=2675851 RepID=A0A7K1UQ07_9NOCA|nr:hypothetical protein [Nocardia terrae]MVU76425.1 hypothetical protein [Nocardia terrae]
MKIKDSERLWWTVGAILTIQGFGSGITEMLWGHSFGVAGLVIHYGAPIWTSWVVGALGVAGIGWAIRLGRLAQPKNAAASR